MLLRPCKKIKMDPEIYHIPLAVGLGLGMLHKDSQFPVEIAKLIGKFCIHPLSKEKRNAYYFVAICNFMKKNVDFNNEVVKYIGRLDTRYFNLNHAERQSHLMLIHSVSYCFLDTGVRIAYYTRPYHQDEGQYSYNLQIKDYQRPPNQEMRHFDLANAMNEVMEDYVQMSRLTGLRREQITLPWDLAKIDLEYELTEQHRICYNQTLEEDEYRDWLPRQTYTIQQLRAHRSMLMTNRQDTSWYNLSSDEDM